MRECRFCGQLFQEENGHQVFCSEHCRREQQKLLRKIKRKEKISTRNFRPRRSHLEWTDEDLQRRINSKSDKMIYIGGYTGSEADIYLQCKDCGCSFKVSARILRRKCSILCRNCQNLLNDIHIKENKEEVLKRKEQKKQQRDNEKVIREEKLHKTCKRCGNPFVTNKINQVYCSSICYKRQSNSNAEHLRRLRIKSQYHDSISLEILYQRDKGKCWICKRKTDYNDKYIDNKGNQITGINHPSIDHVIPLSKGGSHTWDNVRLAHMGCNTEKNNKMLIMGNNSQIYFVL